MSKPPSGWRLGGEIGGGSYLLWGGLLFGVKFVIDYIVASSVFQKRWTFMDMLAPALNVSALSSKSGDQRFYLTMLLIAVPFALVGIHLTLNRLRSADLPRWLVVLFFMPVVNLLYFVVLACLPAARRLTPSPRNRGEGWGEGPATLNDRAALVPDSTSPLSPALSPVYRGEGENIALDYGLADPGDRGWRKLLPADAKLSAVVVSCITAPPILGLTALSVYVMRSYGLGLFVGMPFIIGLVASVLHGQRQPRTLAQCLGVATLSVLVAGVTFVLFAIDGIICVIMMLPIAIVLALIGAMIGYTIQKRPTMRDYAPRTLGMPLIALPILMYAEHFSHPPPPEFVVTTSIEIDAPPDVVWPLCVETPQLPPPREWLFRAGIAYPVRTQRIGGEFRACVLSTGAMIEKIDVWKPGDELHFVVFNTPPAMEEWSPWQIHPPHVTDVMQVHAGQFRLIALPANRTRVEGTSWYHHDIWPAVYWRLWSDHIVQMVHRRVLNEIKILSEAEYSSR